MDWATFAGVFGLIFLVELPDKTVVATIVMAARGRPTVVLAAAGAALTLQMGIAAVAGGLLSALPTTPKGVVIALVFLAGAAYLLFVPEKKEMESGERRAARETVTSAWRTALTAFTVVFVAEFGDLSQIQAANLVARTHRELVVFAASALAVVSVTALAAYAGQFLVRRVPLARIRTLGGLVFAAFGVYELVTLAS